MSFLQSAAVLTGGALLAKVIGVFYRVPLANLLGSYGMGLYQTAYPLFCVFLTFSSSGVTVSLSRIVAREEENDGLTVKAALKLFALVGLTASLLLALIAPMVSAAQGDGSLLPCYFALAPAVLPVALIAVLRGYFQGKGNMFPTAISELTEQLVKAACGLFFAYRYQNSPETAAFYTLLSVTLSEAVALAVLFFRYRAEPRRKTLKRAPRAGSILSATLPVTAATSLLPLSSALDSILVVRLLGYTGRSIALYGLLSGGAGSLTALASTLCRGIALSAVPLVSSDSSPARKIFPALALTLLFSVPLSAGLLLFAPQIVRFLFPAVGDGVLIKLVQMGAAASAPLACAETLAACLAGMGRAKKAASSMLAAVAVKHILEIILVPVPAYGIFGAAAAVSACYLVAFFLDLVYTVSILKSYEVKHAYGDRTRNGEGRPLPQGGKGPSGGRRGARAHRNAGLADT